LWGIGFGGSVAPCDYLKKRSIKIVVIKKRNSFLERFSRIAQILK
jgi:hypothetical protein